jgi:hypothetical protein
MTVFRVQLEIIEGLDEDVRPAVAAGPGGSDG